MPKSALYLMLTATLILSAVGVIGAVPETLSFQGRLLDNSDNPINDGVHSVVFEIYSVSNGGTPLWGETRTVTTANGLFNIILGITNPLNESLFTGADRYLAVTYNGEEVLRSLITSVPYAQKSHISDLSASTLSLENGVYDNDWLVSGNNMYSNNTGEIGIGTMSTEGKVHVEDYSGVALIGSTTDGWGMFARAWGTGDGLHAISSGGKAIVAETPGRSAEFATQTHAGKFYGNVEITGGNLIMGPTTPEGYIHVEQSSGTSIIGSTTNGWGMFARAWGTGDGLHAVSTGGKAIVAETPGKSAEFATQTHAGKFSGNVEITFGLFTAGGNIVADGLVTANDNLTVAGDVGIGTTAPGDKLEVNGTIRLDNGTGNGNFIRFVNAGTKKWAILHRPWAGEHLSIYDEIGTRDVMTFESNTGEVGIGTTTPNYTLDVRGTIGNNTTLYHSDKRWKKEILTIGHALDKISKLRGVTFKWRTDEFSDMNFPEGEQIGLIAQEVEDVIPEVVNTGDDGFKSVEYANLVAVLIEAVKELKADNELLKQELKDLKKRLMEYSPEN